MTRLQNSTTSAQTGAQSRFIRRTYLGPDEYHVNFRQIDSEILTTLTSATARQVTPLMSHIYLALINAPTIYWERSGILRFGGEVRDGKPLTAWQQLRALTTVANSTLSKALNWLHETGMIGYSAGRNGAGIRIFINRAKSSIRTRQTEKNLLPARIPSVEAGTPSVGIPFKEEISEEHLELEKNPPALTRQEGSKASSSVISPNSKPNIPHPPALPANFNANVDYLNKTLSQFKAEVSETVAAVCSREVARTRDWLEKAGLPKAVRVAQHETYQVLRRLGIVEKPSKSDHKTRTRVGLASPQIDLSREEVVKLWMDLANSVRGKSLDEMLTEYVTRGDMTEGEARSIIHEARSMGGLK